MPPECLSGFLTIRLARRKTRIRLLSSNRKLSFFFYSFTRRVENESGVREGAAERNVLPARGKGTGTRERKVHGKGHDPGKATPSLVRLSLFLVSLPVLDVLAI